MTVDEVVYKVKHKSPIPLGSDWVEENLRPALLTLVRTESERCLEIVKRYKQLDADSWGPGASNPPDWSKAYDEILATLPGK